MSSYMKFSEFNREDEEDIFQDSNTESKLPIRHDIRTPRNPPLFSDQYAHRQTAEPLYYNPHERYVDSNHMTTPQYINPYNQRELTTPPTSTQRPMVSMLNPSLYQNNTLSYKTPTTIEHFNEKSSNMSSDQPISCLEVNEHIMTCPICSNYYKSYSYLYIGIIIILLIIIMFLFKSLSEKRM